MTDQFYVQLEQLDEIATKWLPGIAGSIAEANAQLKEATGWISRAFDTEGESMHDERPWNAEQPYQFYLFYRPGNECYYATDFMRQIFDDNYENVTLAAQAVKEIANRYRQADGQG
ncbi:hypothetical protein [Actinophytocola oryzae]|uniref:Uncharacterized protein n=1 Tax=Actinophytocola oryzae TaxID=502181 RepID=A0A4R7VVS7_9PSEU|nr:hypothetical protein [Actinophytocola oryzae]TDV53738.1 hypothetical protein CLV71_104206 [Actinophytocola oryzae]